MAMQITQGNTAFIDYFPIHFMGDVAPIRMIFNSVAMICQANFVSTSISIAMGLSIATMVLNFIRGKIGIQGIIVNLALSLLIVLGFFVKAQVTIIDSRTKIGSAVVGALGRAEVANVPYPLALISSLGSFLSFELVRAIEPAITLDVDAPTYTEFGFMKHLHYTFSKTQIDVSNPAVVNWIDSYKNYIIDCVRPYGDAYDLKMLSENVSLDVINPRNMNSIIARNTPDLMLTSQGRKCQDVYNEISFNFKNNGIANAVRDALRRGIGASNNAVYANIANKASYLYQQVTDNATGFDGYTNFLLRPMLQTNATNAKIASSIGVGGGITGSSSVANAEAFLSKARVDGASLSSWLVWNEWVDTALNIVVMLTYIIFPFVAMIALATPLETKINMAKNYFGGILVVNLYPLGLAIIHSICIYFLHKNVGDMLMGVGNTSPIYNAEYYKEIADYATISTLLGSVFGVMLPFVIYTGAVGKLIGAALSRISSIQAGDVGSYTRESANAQALNNVAQDIGTSAGAMERVSMMSAAIGSSAVKLGDWSQMEGEDANQGRSKFLEALKEAEKFNQLSNATSNSEAGSYIASGGFEGAKQAGTAVTIGDVMQNGHTWTDKSDGQHSVSGMQIAKGTGSMAGAGAVASGMAGAESRIIDDNGRLGGKEGSNYFDGTIGTQRMQQNQTIGVGKHGTFSLDEMSNIQRLSASNVQSQIMQGEALKREYGTGGSNPLLGDGYKQDVLTSNREKWKQAKAANSKLRVLFGDELDEEYKGMTRDEVLSENMDMKLKGEAGSASGYKNAKEKYNNNDISYESALESTEGKLSSTQKEAKKIEQMEKNKLEQAHQQLTRDYKIRRDANLENNADYQQAKNDWLQSKQSTMQDYIKNWKDYGYSSLSEAIKAVNSTYSQTLEQMKADFDNGNTLAKPSSLETFIDNNSSSRDTILSQIADTKSTSSAIQFSQTMSQVSAYQKMGVADSDGLTALGYKGSVIGNIEQAKGLLNNVAVYGNANSIDTFAKDNMSSEQRRMLANAKDDIDRARLFNLMTTGKNLQGFIGDKSFSVGFGGAGTTSSYMGSINSQISRSMGFSSNAGNGFDAMAYGAGGMRGMEAMAVAGTAFNTAMSVANNIGGVMRVGRMASSLTSRVLGGGGGGGGSSIAPTPSALANAPVTMSSSAESLEASASMILPEGTSLSFSGGGMANLVQHSQSLSPMAQRLSNWQRQGSITQKGKNSHQNSSFYNNSSSSLLESSNLLEDSPLLDNPIETMAEQQTNLMQNFKNSTSRGGTKGSKNRGGKSGINNGGNSFGS